MTLDHDLIRRVRDLDEFDLRRLSILLRGLLVARGAEAPSPSGQGRPRTGKVTYRQELVRCGRAGCTRCPHGPYWYAYWREGGRQRSRYVGKELPRGTKR